MVYIPFTITNTQVVPCHPRFHLHFEPDTIEFDVASQILYGSLVFVSFKGVVDSRRHYMIEVTVGVALATIVTLFLVDADRTSLTVATFTTSFSVDAE